MQQGDYLIKASLEERYETLRLSGASDGHYQNVSILTQDQTLCTIEIIPFDGGCSRDSCLIHADHPQSRYKVQ